MSRSSEIGGFLHHESKKDAEKDTAIVSKDLDERAFRLDATGRASTGFDPVDGRE